MSKLRGTKFSETALGRCVVRVDRQDALKTESAFFNRRYGSREPEPGHLVSWLVLGGLPEQLLGLLPLASTQRSHAVTESVGRGDH